MKVTLEDVSNKASSNLAQKDIDGLMGDYPIFGASGYIGNVDFYHQEREYIAVVKDGAGVGRTMYLPAKSSVIGTLQYILPKDNIVPRYLYYAVRNMKLERYYMGAAIPHIYYKDYKKEIFELPDIDEQKRIVDILEKVENIISYYKQQLEELDILIKSRFVEMFGDPVSNPKGWKIKSCKEISSKIGSGATPKGGRESYGTEGITLIRSMNVYNNKFEYKDLAYITDEQAHKLDNVIIEENDVLLNITGASVARCCIVPSELIPARVNQHVAIIRCKSDVLPAFVSYMLTNASYQRLLWNIATSGGATREAITKQQIEQLQFIVPPITIQQEFVQFAIQVDKLKFLKYKAL